MKKLIVTFSFLIFLVTNFGIGNSTCYAQSHTVSYNIPDWNASGSFTFETGSSLNKTTNKTEGFIKITRPLPDGNSKVIVINSEKIDLILQRLKTNSILKANGISKLSKVQDKKELVIKKLESIKTLLKNPEKLKQLSAKLNKNSGTSTLNWDYTIQSVDGIETEVTGDID